MVRNIAILRDLVPGVAELGGEEGAGSASVRVASNATLARIAQRDIVSQRRGFKCKFPSPLAQIYNMVVKGWGRVLNGFGETTNAAAYPAGGLRRISALRPQNG